MKILNIICATLMAVAFASCDEHRDFPDTAMKTCDILCTDGKVVSFEEVKSQNKTPIAVVFYVNQNEAMKILNIICATLMAVAFASCDEHRDFPDTAMKTCDILCTDRKVVRFEEVKSQNKTPIAVVFYVNQNEDIQGTVYAVYLKDIEPFAYSDSLGLKHNTSADIYHLCYSHGSSICLMR